MFPGVNGFHYTFGHILFVTVFLLVILTVATTVALAFLRSALAVRKQRKVAAILWKQDFHDLPIIERSCRHELSGKVDERVCPNAFDCRACSEHPSFGQPARQHQGEVLGLFYPQNRLYHRGHTWVETEPDGTLKIGLDEIANRLLGKPDEVELPAAGDKLHANGPGWRVSKDRHDIRVLAPVDGEVVEVGGPEAGFYLRVKPEHQPPDLRHLLRGTEVEGWVRRELERVQMACNPEACGATLADGGELMHDLIHNVPVASWDPILAQVFLEP